jgi:DNA-binding response OmpR family regulator
MRRLHRILAVTDYFSPMMDSIGKTTDVRKLAWSYVLDEPVRILVVDDDPILREFASVYLATPSATIDTAEDGAVALARLSKGDYDAVLADIEMPRLDGFSLVERIRRDPRLRHMPVIMLTGHEDIVSIDRAYQVGATSFVTKPVNWRQLSYQIRYVIRTSRRTAGAPPVQCAARPEPADCDARQSLQAIIERLDAAARTVSRDDWARLQAEISSAREVAMRAIDALTPPASARSEPREDENAVLS